MVARRAAIRTVAHHIAEEPEADYREGAKERHGPSRAAEAELVHIEPAPDGDYGDRRRHYELEPYRHLISPKKA
jgi:hypothetical protein